MRTALAVVILCTGCATTAPMTTVTTTPIRRVVFSTQPSSSATLAGSSGVGLRMNMMTGTAESTRSDGAVSFPLFQPDLGVLVKVGPNSYLGGRLAIAAAAFGAQSPTGVIGASNAAGAFDASVGGGHDFRFGKLLGLSLSGEVGMAGMTLTKQIRGSVSSLELLPVLRGTVGFFAQPGDFRFYAGGTMGTSVTNDADGVQTETCTLDCSSTETGAMNLGAVAMVGGGARWQANSFTSLALEGWVPLSETNRFPFMISLSLRLGDFTKKPPPLSPPPPPPDVIPDAEVGPIQL